MSYFQTMYGSDDLNTQFTDKDAHFGELVLRAIRDVDCPMLITTGESDAVKMAVQGRYTSNDQQVIRLHKLGLTASEIALKTGLATTDVYKILNKRKERS